MTGNNTSSQVYTAVRISSILFIVLMLVSCLKEDELKKPFESFEPRQLNDGWQISDPESEHMDANALTRIYEDLHQNPDTWQVRSMLVFRNGKLVAESYTKDDDDLTTPRAIWSATKQVVGLLTGIAIENHLINSVHDSISLYLHETADYADKQAITIEDLLTMRSGIDYSNDGLEGQTDDILRQLPDSITRFILSLPLAHQPGEHFMYKDCDPQLMASVIQQQCNTSLLRWSQDVLFNKLEIRNLEWDTYKDGTTLGGFGILTTPRELAKFGQCVADSGVWKGNRIVSKEWIKEMTTVRYPDAFGYGFGYLWWRDPVREIDFMAGHGGQYVFIVPSKDLIVVMTSEVNTQGEFQFNRDEALEVVDKVVLTVEN